MDAYTEDFLAGTGDTSVEARKKLIEGWNKDKHRKDEAFKAYECLKDKTINYVFDLLQKQFDVATVIEMQYAMANVSIFRKVIDKLAKVYANGVKRTMPMPQGAKPETPAEPPAPVAVIAPAPVDPADPSKGFKPASTTPPKPKVETQADRDTKVIEEIADILKFNAAMKKTNRYFRAFLNTLVQVRPLPVDDKFTIKLEVKPPFSYDVVEDPGNPALPLAVICSEYTPSRSTLYALGDAATAGRTVGVVRDVKPPQIAKLSKEEEDAKEYIWWTKNYHFTTNGKGVIDPSKSEDGNRNPIGMLPFVNFAGEQDTCFWAEGGADLIDAGIKINTMITNVRHVAITQGYGQLYMIGTKLPKSVKVGPNHCIQMEKQEGDTTATEVGYLTSNPPLEKLQALIEMDVALMLSTNNLSTSGVSTSLKGGGKDMASGVALMIDKSESIEDIDEQSLVFVEKEPEIWVLVGKFFEVYNGRGLLIDKLKVLKLPADLDKLQIKFPSPKPIVSEKDELLVLKERQDMGLNTQVEIMMRDDPSLSEEEALAKIERIQAERAANRAKFGFPTDADESLAGGQKPGAPGAPSGNQGQGGGGGFGQNGNQPGTNQGPQGNPGAN